MSAELRIIQEYIKRYKEWVRQNPAGTAEVESVVRLGSLFLAGRFNGSNALSELAYTASNLFVFINDTIIASSKPSSIDKKTRDLSVILTILEYSEVLLEIIALQKLGTKGKWSAIWGIQLLKASLRLTLLLHHKVVLLGCPAVPMQVRTKENAPQKQTVESVSFTLKHSGKTVRKVQASPPIAGRSWKPINNPKKSSQPEPNNKYLYGEIAYILRPIVHLTANGVFGSKSWKPWIFSLVCELISLSLLHGAKSKCGSAATDREEMEISRRSLLLLFYLMRSPLYDHYTKKRISRLLNGCANNIPLTSYITNPILQYLPHFQTTYGYIWST